MPSDEVPLWDGDPSSFEAFVTSCRWYECSLKDSERKLAAPRIWQKLTGAAKSVVKHLDPKDFDSSTGLDKLLAVLRESPLQKLPIPDSFSRLEKWTGLRRSGHETIPQLLVREEELFVELQQALQRARHERQKHEVRSTGTGVRERDPAESPTRSPQGFRSSAAEQRAEVEDVQTTSLQSPTQDNTGFFENELRGYRLLKASKLSSAERQHVMTLTKNSTHFTLIRQALRSLFADSEGQDDNRMVKKTVWYASEPTETWDASWNEEQWVEPDWYEEEAYWADGSPSNSWDAWDDYDYSYEDATQVPEGDPTQQPDAEEVDESRRLEEAYALAADANKTLAEAKSAVAKVRAARGYYDSSGMKGGSSGHQKGKSKSKTGKGKSKYGACFICGRHGHSYLHCPDRWASGKGSSPSSMRSKGKPGGKGKVYAVEYEYEHAIPDINVLSMFDNNELAVIGTAYVVLDTGATESVAGVSSMSRMIATSDFEYTIALDDRPKFRFGNGECQRAVSKITVWSAALGPTVFYLLDGGAENTPPLLGSREFRKRKAIISYNGDYVAHVGQEGNWWANSLQALRGGHLLLDLREDRKPLADLLKFLEANPFNAFGGGSGGAGSDGQDPPGGDGPAGSGDRGKKRSRGDQGHNLVRATAAWHGGGTVRSVLAPNADRSHDLSEDEVNNVTPPVSTRPSPSTMPTSRSPEQNDCVERSDSREDDEPENESPPNENRVLMVMSVNDGHAHDVDEPNTNFDNLDDKLSNLAQRLKQFKQRHLAYDEQQAMHSSDRVGSQAEWLAMSRSPSSWTGKDQPLCNVASLQNMRSPSSLCGKGWLCRRDSSYWPTSSTSGPSSRGTAARVHSTGDDGEDLQWQANGASRQILGRKWRPWKDYSPSASQREDGRSTPRAVLREERAGQDKAEGQDSKGARTGDTFDGSSKDTIEDSFHTNTGASNTLAEAHDSQEGAAAEASGISLNGGLLHADQRLGGRGGGGGRQGQEQQGQGQWREGMRSLRSALDGLRARMRGGGTPDNPPEHCQPRLEAANDNQSQSTTLTSTPHPKMTSNETTPESNCVAEKVYAMMNAKEKVVRPSLARRLATAATMTTVLMNPIRDLIGMVTPEIDILEVACSPESTLTATFQDQGYVGQRVNYLTVYDLDSRKGTTKLAETIAATPPKLTWVSMSCTRLSALQNLTPRTEEQMDRFLKRRGRDLQRCDEVAQSLEPALREGHDVAWEWPTTAVTGWRSKAISRLQKIIRKYGRQVYWIQIDGCCYGLLWRGIPIKKAWTILTTSRELWLTLNKRCDKSHEHAACRGNAAQASAYYPPQMCKDVCKAMSHAWKRQNSSLERLVETYLLENHIEDHLVSSADLHPRVPQQVLPGPGEQQVYALTRRRLDLDEAPKGKKLEAVKQMMLRVHRASGHAGMSNLVQLLRAKGAPGWALELAGKLECPECKEASKPRPRPPASTGEEPKIYEILGTDVFEFEDEKKSMKFKMIIWRDRGSGLTMIDHLKTYTSGSWEPTSLDIIRSLNKWIMVYPSPRWVMADAARYYTSSEFMDHLNRSGIGLTIAPAEAHWLMGSEESSIGIAKRTVERLLREGSSLEIPNLFTMAAGAMNAHVGPSGFSAFQWAFGAGGGILDDERLLEGIDPNKAFGNLVKQRERAKLAFEKERASERFSKLANAVGRQVTSYKPGQLVMLWRQKVKPGKVKGAWTGPLRLILMEGSTAWLASGATLVRAKLNQIRPTSKREDLDAMLEGTAIFKTPVSVESLMRSFQGRYYLDVAGDVPSEERQRQDLSPGEVLVEPGASRSDSWSLHQEGDQRVLVRHHGLPRLALFNPLRSTNCPISLDELSGKRTTIVRPLHGGSEATIHDTVDVQRTLQDRWIGETH